MQIFIFSLIFLIGLYFFALIFYKNYKYKNFYNFHKSLNYNIKNTKIFSYVFLFLSFLSLFFAVFFTDFDSSRDRLQSVSTEVVFLLDVSKSMKAMDYTNGQKSISRLDTAKKFIGDFLYKYPNFSYGLSIFAGETIGISPLTSDLSMFSTFLSGVDENNVGKQGTDLAGAISYSLSRFLNENKNTKKILVLISDGGDEELKEAEISKALKIIEKNNIELYIVGVGTEKGAYIPEKTDIRGEITYKTYNGEKVLSSLNKKSLENLASLLSGKYLEIKKYSEFDFKNFFGTNFNKNIDLAKNYYLILLSFLYFLIYISLLFLPKILGKK